jgi:hypothetical protein
VFVSVCIGFVNVFGLLQESDARLSHFKSLLKQITTSRSLIEEAMVLALEHADLAPEVTGFVVCFG